MNIDWSIFGLTQAPIRRSGGQYRVPCPFCKETRHNPKDTSMAISIETGLYFCHHCGVGGCADTDKQDNDKYRRKREPVRERPKIYKLPEQQSGHSLNAGTYEWFANRGISRETVDKMRITEGTEMMPPGQGGDAWGYAGTIQFNYYMGDEKVNVKYRTRDKRFRMVQGAQLIPYNADAIFGQKECVITEGEMDALSFIEIGIENVVSVPNGASNTAWIDDFFDSHFDDKETIYLAVDTDVAGVRMRDELLRRFGAERCKVLTYGRWTDDAGAVHECKDANEELMHNGADALRACLTNAPETKISGVFTFDDYRARYKKLREEGLQKGKTIGFPLFDEAISFETKRLCIVTGIPSSGKSEFIDMIVVMLNLRYGWRVAYFSPENFPMEYHASKITKKLTGKRFNTTDMTEAEDDEATERINDDFSWIDPENYKIDTILDRARAIVRRRGIKILVIDPYNRIEDAYGDGSETRHVSRILDRLTDFAHRNDVLVILMAHPKKMGRDEKGMTEKPNMYDISGSATFYDKADYGIIVHRHKDTANESNNYTEVDVAKVKFNFLGKGGSVYFKYNTSNGRYSEIGLDGSYQFDDSNFLRAGKTPMQTDIFEYPLGAYTNDDAPF